MKISAIISAIILIVLTGVYVKLIGKNFYAKYNQISAEQFNTQKNEDYYVYFYMGDCGDCKLIEDKMKNLVNKISSDRFYVVDMKTMKNKKYWYSWEEHHTRYDIEIGEINNLGEEIFYDGESREKYQKDVNVKYEVIIADKDYLYENNKAKINKIYAKDNTAKIDVNNLNEETLKISWVPTILHIENGKVQAYFSENNIKEFLENY